jgi:hypothetical protein
MEDSVRNIRNMLAQGRQQLRQAMASLQNNAGINGASGSKRQQTGQKRHDEEFADCLREYQELGPTFHADMSFKDFCTVKHPEWYEPQVSVDKKVKVPRKKANGAYGEETPSTMLRIPHHTLIVMLMIMRMCVSSWMDRMIAHVLHLPYQAVLRIQHFSIVVTLVRIHMCWHLDMMRLGGWMTYPWV